MNTCSLYIRMKKNPSFIWRFLSDSVFSLDLERTQVACFILHGWLHVVSSLNPWQLIFKKSWNKDISWDLECKNLLHIFFLVYSSFLNFTFKFIIFVLYFWSSLPFLFLYFVLLCFPLILFQWNRDFFVDNMFWLWFPSHNSSKILLQTPTIKIYNLSVFL